MLLCELSIWLAISQRSSDPARYLLASGNTFQYVMAAISTLFIPIQKKGFDLCG